MDGLKVNTEYTHGTLKGLEKKNKQVDSGFYELVKGAVNRVNKDEIEANQNIEKMTKGKVGIHETMISLQKADISLRLLLQIRNKAMEAYREIMRMPF